MVTIYIGNTHTKRVHHRHCRSVPTIAKKHIEYTSDGSGFDKVCHWCFALAYKRSKYQKSLDDFKEE